jgi:hypothetical protein
LTNKSEYTQGYNLAEIFFIILVWNVLSLLPFSILEYLIALSRQEDARIILKQILDCKDVDWVPGFK